MTVESNLGVDDHNRITVITDTILVNLQKQKSTCMAMCRLWWGDEWSELNFLILLTDSFMCLPGDRRRYLSYVRLFFSTYDDVVGLGVGRLNKASASHLILRREAKAIFWNFWIHKTVNLVFMIVLTSYNTSGMSDTRCACSWQEDQRSLLW